MLLSYVLLFGLIVFAPFLATTLRRVPTGRLDDGSPSWLVLRAALQGVLQGTLVLVWTNAYPPLIRPIFTWVGSSPNIQVIQPVQGQGGILVALGVLGAIGRTLVEAV